MANDTTGQVWKIDTGSSTALTTYPVKIKKFVWDEPTTAAHDLTITDGLGNTIWDVDARNYGNGVQETFDLGDGIWFSGLIVSVIDSGTLYIYFA